MAEKKKLKSEASSSNSNDRSAADAADCSVVSDIGRRRSSCGYCRSAGHSSVSHGLWAYSLTVDDYQVLLDRGWRRSGCYLYKPEMERTCCPSYTIRLKAGEFAPSKEQLRVTKRMQRFLDGTLDAKRLEKSLDEPKGTDASFSYSKIENASQVSESRCVNREEGKNKVEQLTQSLSHQIGVVVQEFVGRGELPIDLQLPKASVKIVPPAKRKLLVQESERLLFTCNISFQIFAALRRSKKDYRPEIFSKSSAENNDQQTGLSPHKIADTLVEHLYQVLLSTNLLVRACNGHINFYSTEKHDQLDDIVKSGTVLKDRPESVLKKSAGNMSSKGRHLEIRLKRSSFDPEEYALYRKYQLEVHNDTPEHVSESSYQRFLVDSPLIFVPPTGDETVPSCGFGSFHQQYLIDGKLVAVGVIDILPKCLSSKYLFWDPDLAPLSLGKFSAFQEIKWVSENQVRCPSLQYYYLGYYIHSCNKMRYKAAYRPSELLCPLRYQWIPFDIAKPLLDRKKYVALSDFASSHSGESLTPTILDNQMEEEHDDLSDGGKNDTFVHQDDEMVEDDSDESDEDLDLELPSAAAAEDGDVGDVLIGMKSLRLRFKDVRQAFEPSGRRYLENQLQRYMRAVGVELSERMVYMFS